MGLSSVEIRTKDIADAKTEEPTETENETIIDEHMPDVPKPSETESQIQTIVNKHS